MFSPSSAPFQEGDTHTAREILQQPEVWHQARQAVEAARTELDPWLDGLLARPDLRIILTGAGSSAYIGEVLARELTAALARPVAAISTTELVSDPAGNLLSDRPTLLISYGRSGNSPESLATVDLADQCIAECHHLVLSCDPDSALVLSAGGRTNMKVLLMPPASLDQSFAMTSSFSAMVLSTLMLFLADFHEDQPLIAAAQAQLALPCPEIDAIIGSGFGRLVFLGSGSLHAVAREAALKSLELSAGISIVAAESSLGFRHGPKFMVDGQTVVVILPSPSDYTRGYDLELASELERDGIAKQVVRMDRLVGATLGELGPASLGLLYLVWCQRFALRNALSLGIDPDNPSSDGTLNRVVQGVTIRPYPGRQP